jgi:hypothetical protein
VPQQRFADSTEVRMNKVGKGLTAIAALLVMALVAAGPATAQDRNHDKIPDKWEKQYNLSLKVNQAKRDQDSDTLKNRVEFKLGTSPRSEDSDDDGIEDADENAGTIASFDGTTLTIDLAAGGTLVGVVDDATEIECGRSCGHDGDDDATDDDGDDDATDDDSADDDEGTTVARTGRDDDDIDDEDGDDEDSDHPNGPGPDGQPTECSVDDLVEGAVVSDAEYTTADDETVTFTEVELGD